MLDTVFGVLGLLLVAGDGLGVAPFEIGVIGVISLEQGGVAASIVSLDVAVAEFYPLLDKGRLSFNPVEAVLKVLLLFVYADGVVSSEIIIPDFIPLFDGLDLPVISPDEIFIQGVDLLHESFFVA